MNENSHWLDGVVLLLEAKTGDLRQLAAIVGQDPVRLYQGTLPASEVNKLASLEGVGSPSELNESIVTELIEIRGKPTQAQRAILFLKLAYHFPGYSRQMVENFIKEAAGEKLFVFEFVRSYTSRIDLFENGHNVIYADSVRVAMRMLHPFSRASFIYWMARELGYIPEIAYLAESHNKPNWSMRSYHSEIKEYLAEWRSMDAAQ